MTSDQDIEFRDCMAKLRQAVVEILPGTDAEREISELCRQLMTEFSDVRDLSRTRRDPIVLIASESTSHRHWVVSSLRRGLSQQLEEQAFAPHEDLDGFGSSRPGWLPSQSRFDVIMSDVWNGVNPWSCLSIDPSKPHRVDADIVLYVVDFEDLQTDASIRMVKRFAGIPLVPVVLGVIDKGGKDVESFIKRLDAAIGNPCLSRLEFPNFQDKRTTASVGEAERQIWSQCQGVVYVSDSDRRRIQDERYSAIRRRFYSESRDILRRSDFGRVNQVINDLMEEEKKVLKTQATEWLSVDSDLRVPIRLRLRLIACEVTPRGAFRFDRP